MKIAFFGSSLLSSYWNGAATYYRGVLRALHDRGHSIVFYEPDAWDRQKHRDIAPPEYARSVVYAARNANDVTRVVEEAARNADLLVKASGVGAFDTLLEALVLEVRTGRQAAAFWDVDAAATLESLETDPAPSLRRLIPQYDIVFTYGGGAPVVNAYRALGARACVPIYNGLDPATHFPAPPDPAFEAVLAFLGNRLPDRERRVDEFFFHTARKHPGFSMLLGGSGWDDVAARFANVRYIGHVYTSDHNAFNSTPRAVLNICRDSMARCGFSPPTRVFEAAGAGACLITDLWEGIDSFFEPEHECLIARNGDQVGEILGELTPARAAAIGAAARTRALRDHTYAQRAREVENALRELGL